MDTLKELVLEEQMSEKRQAAILAWKWMEGAQHKLEMLSHHIDKPDLKKAMKIMDMEQDLREFKDKLDNIIDELHYDDFMAYLEQEAHGE